VQTSPEQYTPRITRWGHIWRTAWMLGFSAAVWTTTAIHQWREQRPLFWLDAAGGLVALTLVYYRRRWPFGVALVNTLIGAFSTSAAGPGVLAAVSMATRRRWREIIPVAATNVAATVVYAAIEPGADNGPRWVTYTLAIVTTFAVLAVGMYIGSRRELLWTLRDRAETAENEQGLRVDQARANERARIAREMHDVLAHRISLVTMHAGALAYRTDLTPDQVRESA
jgi:signal transduction histidine kinase